jgi:hypothetical protein
MKYLLKIAGLILFILSISLVNSCKKDKPTLPSLTTVTVGAISYSTATSGGNITNEGGASVISRGVCWDTSAEPTTANSITSDGGGTGEFTSNLSQLTQNTLYYVRPDKPHNPRQQRNLHHQMEAMEHLRKARVGVPPLAQLHARIGQHKAPRPRAQKV